MDNTREKVYDKLSTLEKKERLNEWLSYYLPVAVDNMDIEKANDFIKEFKELSKKYSN